MELHKIITEGSKAAENNRKKRILALDCAEMLGDEKTKEAEKAREAIMDWLAADATGR